jgi:hypothetical protein
MFPLTPDPFIRALHIQGVRERERERGKYSWTEHGWIDTDRTYGRRKTERKIYRQMWYGNE